MIVSLITLVLSSTLGYIVVILGRRSIDSRRVSEDRAPSEMVSMQLPPPTVLVPQSVDETNTIHESQTTELPTPIPITVTPASLGINGPDFPQTASLQDQLSSPLENGSSEKRSTSLDEKDRDVSRGKKVKDALKKECGENWVSEERFRWFAPNFAGTGNSLNALKTWNVPLDPTKVVAQFSSHKYVYFLRNLALRCLRDMSLS